MKYNRNVIKAKDEVIDVEVRNLANEDLGNICEIMLNKTTGKVAYAVLDTGGF